MKLTESLKGTYCRIFFDNFYTSPQVVYRLMKERKIYSCETVRGHRRGLPKDMKLTKDLKKGEIDSRYYDGMSVVKWLDNKSVLIISTIKYSQCQKTTKRLRRKGGYKNSCNGSKVRQMHARNRPFGSKDHSVRIR